MAEADKKVEKAMPPVPESKFRAKLLELVKGKVKLEENKEKDEDKLQAIIMK